MVASQQNCCLWVVLFQTKEQDAHFDPKASPVYIVPKKQVAHTLRVSSLVQNVQQVRVLPMDIGDYTHRLFKLDQVWLVLQDAKGRLQYQLDLPFCKRTFSEQKIFDKLPVRKFADFMWPNLVISEAFVHEYGAFFVGKNSVVFFVGQ